MDIEELKSIMKQGESHTLEFKKSTAQLKAAFETLCGFSNGQGGTVIIGVNESGKITGQDVTDSTRQEIAREIRKIEPPTQISTLYVPCGNGKDVIVLQAQGFLYPPYVYDSRSFQRNQSTTSRMPQHLYEQLLVKRGHLNYAWDEMIVTGYGIDDLDHEEIRRTILQGANANRFSQKALSEPIPEILHRLKLTKDGFLKNAALVLFAKDAEDDYPQFYIRMARFEGLTKTGPFIDNQTFHGNAFRILERANEFVRRHLPIASSYQENKLERIDTPALPMVAIREALINAISHRDYSKRNSSIALAIYDDRLEIWNPGKLPVELTIPDLAQTHNSVPRNDLVSQAFYICNLIEKWGTGTNKMIDLCLEQNLPPPEFTEYSGGLSISFRFKEQVTKLENLPLKLEKLNLRQRKIYNLLLNEGPLSPKDIMNKLDEDIPERTLRLDLATLKNSGFLESSGQTTSTVWFIIRKNKN